MKVPNVYGFYRVAVDFIKACNTACKAFIVSASLMFPSAVIFARINEISKLVSSDSFADNAESVNNKDACALSPLVAAVMRATGLSTKSPEETVQSNAFLSEPGTPKAYSGVQIKTAFASESCLRHASTAAGGFMLSLKCGSSASPLYIISSTVGGVHN